MRILLTGASGFLGSSLARYWSAIGHELFLMVRETSNLSRLSDIPPKVRLLRVSGPDEVIAAVGSVVPEVIVHTACSYGRDGERATEVLAVNFGLGKALVQAVLETPPTRGQPTVFINTGTALNAEVSLYALSKKMFSAWGSAEASRSPELLRFIDIRLQNMYGPGDNRFKIATYLLDVCCRNESRIALTEGEQRRDFIHIDDVVQAYDCVLTHNNSFETSETIDVGSGESISLRKFAELIKQLSRSITILDFGALPYRKNEAMLCVADITRLQGLGWHPRISLHQGIREMLQASRDPSFR